MNVLILPSWYTIPENPIAGIFFKEQAIAIRRKFEQKNNDDKVFIVFIEEFGIQNIKTYFKRKKRLILEEDGILTMRTKFFRIPKLHKFNLYLGARCVEKNVKFFSKILGVNFDLVHIHSALNAGIWYSLSNLTIPYVITEHSSAYSRNLISSQKKVFLPNVFEKARKIISVGNGLANEISKYTKKEVDVVFNIVTNLFFDRNVEQKKNKQITFFSLGLNLVVKGFDILLFAFERFISNGYEGKLIIAGLNDTEIKKILELGINPEVMKCIELKGHLDRNSVFMYMCNCDCFALVSRYETFGVVFAEAMYCGKPVIATRTGGPDSFVNNSNGLLVNVEDIEETSEALMYMANNISKYDSEQIKKYAIDNFSPDVICEKLINIYNSVL